MQKKKILIFSSYGGGGHVSATDALYAYLQDEYCLETVYIFDEILGIVDPVKFLSFHHYSGENLYNFCLRKKWTFVVNFLYFCAFLGIRIKYKVIKEAVHDFIKKKNPDLVISVVPLVNGVLQGVCQQISIPFLLIPTDLDIATFIKGMKFTKTNTAKIGLTFKDSLESCSIEIPEKMIYFTGFPLKPSFFQHPDTQEIKKDFQIPERKPIIIVLMGASGSSAMYTFIQEMLKLPYPCHILACLGRNETLREKLDKLIVPPHISISIISYTSRIADLLSIAQVCITKPGTVSVCETIYKEVPMILDGTSTPLLWEKFNYFFVKKYGFGQVVKTYDQLVPALERLLLPTIYRDNVVKNLAAFEKIYFGDRIKKVVKNMLHEDERYHA